MQMRQDLSKNVEYLKQKLTSDDITFLQLRVGDCEACLVFVNDLINKDSVGELILRPASLFQGTPDTDSISEIFLSPEKKEVFSFEDFLTDLLLGNAMLLVDGFEKGFSFGLKQFEKRAISEPPTSTVLKGPREGFVESLPVNISLMRRRLKCPELTFCNISVGKYSKTPIALCYIKGIASEKLVKKIKRKLQSIDIDAEHDVSIFKQIGNTEKPDILSAKILEGRVAILIDGSPIALTVPYLLIEDFQSPSDYYNSSYSATVARNLRLLSIVIALFLPAFFVASELFHLQLIPLSFLLTIVNSIKGIPLSPSYEMFFTLMIFEILNEASVRMPKYVGMVVSIVGGLVLGETAVNAGIISAPTLMIIALSGICLYTAPELEQTFSVLRLFFLIVAGSAGAYGLIVSIAMMLVYLITFENYGAPLLAPFSPLVREDLKDTFYKGFLREMTNRPKSLKNVNKRRLSMRKNKED